MSDDWDTDALSPVDAASIAKNVYCTLNEWTANNSRSVDGVRAYLNNPSSPGSLNKTPLATNDVLGVFSGKTGFVTAGFGYAMMFVDGAKRNHLVLATRGTVPGHKWGQDLITDARGTLAFSDYGMVHNGFKKTFDSVAPSLARYAAPIAKAHTIHCVGHSLGGAVATLIAANIARAGRSVKLYTFGSPRVGWLDAYANIERKIGKKNIYRVAHEMDPISLVGPYPYIHVNPSPPSMDWNNITIPSPVGYISMENHDMSRYLTDTLANESWKQMRGYSRRVRHENSVLCNMLLGSGPNPGWIRVGCAYTLSLLFRMFSAVLCHKSTCLILSLTGYDLLAEIIVKGLYKAARLGKELCTLLEYTALWAGIKMAEGADYSSKIIQMILNRMEATLRHAAMRALELQQAGMTYAPGLTSPWALAAFAPL